MSATTTVVELALHWILLTGDFPYHKHATRRQHAVLLATHVMFITALVVTAVEAYKPPAVTVSSTQSVTFIITVVVAFLASISKMKP